MNDNNPNEKNENMRNSSIPNSGNKLLKNLHAKGKGPETASGKLNSYTAFPSVSIQNKVTSNNTVTDSTLGSYTFIKAPHVSENNRK